MSSSLIESFFQSIAYTQDVTLHHLDKMYSPVRYLGNKKPPTKQPCNSPCLLNVSKNRVKAWVREFRRDPTPPCMLQDMEQAPDFTRVPDVFREFML